MLRKNKNLHPVRHASRSQQGYVLLLSVLISSIVLTLGLSIFNTSVKALSLSALGEESHRAFYAADTGIECVLYWDTSDAHKDEDIFATSTDSMFFGILPTSGVWCEDFDIVAGDPGVGSKWNVAINNAGTPSDPTDDTAITTFAIPVSETCVEIKISKQSGRTVVESSGFNSGRVSVTEPRCEISGARIIQRSLRVKY